MDIKGTVYCFFEQSGVFKNAFHSFGINAVDYDIHDNYHQTTKVVDLFSEIEKAYDGNEASVFDAIDPHADLIMAFFPCIYFSASNMLLFTGQSNTWGRNATPAQKTADVLERSEKRQLFYSRLLKLIAICQRRGLRLIIENPWTQPQYLKNNLPIKPAVIDLDRTLRGDCFKKPTAYWFINCEPLEGLFTPGHSNNIRRVEDVKRNDVAGECNMERSLIEPEYARNFIHDFILGGEE